MAEVELILKADNSQYVNKVREAQKATQELHNTAQRGAQREKGLIEDIEGELNRLQEARKKAWRVEDIEKYNRKIAEAKQDLKEYEQAGVKANEEIKKSSDKLGDSLLGMAKKWSGIATAIALVTKFTKEVVNAFKDTVAGLKLITTFGEVWRQMAYNVATLNVNMLDYTKSLAGAIAVGKAINEQRVQERKDLIETSQLREDYNRLYFESADRTQTLEKQLEKLTEAEKVHNQLIDVELENAKRQLTIIELQLLNRPKSNKLLDEEAKLLAQINTIEGQRYSEVKRVEMRRSGLEKEIRERDKKAYYDWLDERNKQQDEFQKLSLQLLDQYDKSQIESFKGKKKLEAQRDFAVKQIKELRDQMLKLGPLSDEQKQMLQTLADNVWKAYYEELAKSAEITKATPEQQAAISKALLGDMPELQGLIEKDVEKTRKEIEGRIQANKEFSFWNLLGLNPEEDEETIDAIKDMAGKFQEVLESTLQMRVETAQRERELLDNRIAETQREIDLEAELYQQGYANNLTARKAYLEELKVEREKALAAEEKAVRMEQAFERISQTTNIMSSVANLLKNFTKIPIVGIILATAAVGALFALWSSAKSRVTKLAEGGSGTETGMITGKRHSEGGERFLDHVEVEQGEAFGVLSRRATGKYGDIFHEMVNSFNRDEMPSFMPTVSNSVRVENSGPNSRLDKVIREQKRLNDSILKQSQLYSVGGKRIERKGNKVRIIG